MSDLDKWISKAVAMHGNKYSYSLIDVWGPDIKGEILCPQHGTFFQTGRTHVWRRCGCPQCGKIVRDNSRKLSLTEFIEKANELHDGKYDYSTVTYYENNRTKVEISCPIHGSFFQAPAKHISTLNPTGCPKCAGRYTSTEDFIVKAVAVHSNLYDYSQVEYKRANQKIAIGCPVHGIFYQTPNNHLSGYGCKRCAEEDNPGVYSDMYFRTHPEIGKQKGLLYLIRFTDIDNSTFLKVGITKHLEVTKRFTAMFADYLTAPVCTACVELARAYKIEQDLHSELKEVSFKNAHRLVGKGHTECFMDLPIVLHKFLEAVDMNKLNVCYFEV